MKKEINKPNAFEKLQIKAFDYGYLLETKGRYTQLTQRKSWYSPNLWTSVALVVFGIWWVANIDYKYGTWVGILFPLGLGAFILISGITVLLRFLSSILKWNSQRIFCRNYFISYSLELTNDVKFKVFTKSVKMEGSTQISHTLVAFKKGKKHELFILTEDEKESSEVYNLVLGIKRDIEAKRSENNLNPDF